MHLDNIALMHALPAEHQGMDILIISTENAQQVSYWEERLSSAPGVLLKKGARICCVIEDWPGGAGNGLGSLYAFTQARQKMLTQDQTDILEELQQGASIAIYHTAGQGKRLFPLTASAQGNKSAVKLPTFDARGRLLSLLEVVIKQTALFADRGKSRLFVFWGDQVFVPSKQIASEACAPIEILALVHQLPSQTDWERHNFHNYGLIVIDAKGQAKDVDKCQYEMVIRLLAANKIHAEGGAGLSLGSFSLSYTMLLHFLNEFSFELIHQQGKMDSDPYFWMPLTLDWETYQEVMQDKCVVKATLEIHYKRMQAFKQTFSQLHAGHLFGVCDVGKDSFWWDYGTIQTYLSNNLKLCDTGFESDVMRAFFKFTGPTTGSVLGESVIEHSLVMGVTAQHLNIQNSLLLNCTLTEMSGQECLLYNVEEKQPLNYPLGTLRADVALPEHAAKVKIMTDKTRDGKADWDQLLPGNAYTYHTLSRLLRHLNDDS